MCVLKMIFYYSNLECYNCPEYVIRHRIEAVYSGKPEQNLYCEELYTEAFIIKDVFGRRKKSQKTYPYLVGRLIPFILY